MDAITNPPGLTDFDVTAALEATREVTGDDLRAFVEYDDETYNSLFISSQVVGEVGGETALQELAERLYANYQLDFNEQEMYADLYEPLGGLNAFAVFLESEVVVRYVSDRQGVYVSFDPTTTATDVTAALERTLEGDG